MSTWKVLVTDGLSDGGMGILNEAAKADDRQGISAEELLQVIGDYDGLIVRGRTKVNAAVFEAAKKLKVVGRAGVGVDNIDLAAARAKGVTVVNSPKATSQAVAELTIALMFALARSIPLADANMKQGKWIKKQLEGIELTGKTLGIIGVGNIGSLVAQTAGMLGMQSIGFDPMRTRAEILECCVEGVSLAELFARSDFITLHLPLTPETRGMIGGQEFAQMKRGVRLVDVARGGIVDETALIGALESGQVAAAALDVFSDEPPGLTSLVAHPNVIATPHIGAQTEEAQARAGDDIATEVVHALSGKQLRWKIV